MATKKMRHCYFCGESLGMMNAFEYHHLDTCGKTECAREAQNDARAEREDAHERLDRDMGWD